MNDEIVRLGLPRGVWQQLILEAIPEAHQAEISYPDADTLRCQLRAPTGNLIASFEMTFLRGCTGILISHHMSVHPAWQGQGVAKRLQPIKDRIAKDLRVSLILATVRDDNEREKHVIREWKEVATFHNKRTGNQIDIFVKEVT